MIGFIGHRLEKQPPGQFANTRISDGLKALMQKEVRYWAAQGYLDFLFDNEGSLEQVFLEQVLLAKDNGYSDIRLCPERQNSISQTNEADIIKNKKRLVDQANILIAVYDGLAAGRTADTVSYAMEKGITIVILDPGKLTRFVIPQRVE